MEEGVSSDPGLPRLVVCQKEFSWPVRMCDWTGVRSFWEQRQGDEGVLDS